ncbi:hypothetical protein BDV96DRAFT_608476 [Lophiotrema nucula]|uniref:Uncharacterized protein n=1 Tax=Lophiotrema nucula TaxID=690887 RepID=A0A6A5YG40_9PLEO|nr:hypothetical protein BDV96DRAFT_608476 [Lophiotrema nucula]
MADADARHALGSNNEYMIENHRYIAAVREFSHIYARRCYGENGSHTSPDCQIFTRTSIPYTSSMNASCPFDVATCVYPDNNLQLDTGLMDTKTLLGINTDKHNLPFRKITTCGPLKPDHRTTKINETDGDGFPGYHEYWNWGTMIGIGYDYIAEALSFDSLPFAGYSMITPRYYQTSPILEYPNQSSFIPIREFNISNGDVHLLFLEPHSTDFAAPCDDPWFSAHDAYTSPTNATSYFSDNLLNPMGCVEQFGFCNPNSDNDACTALGGILPAAASAKFDLNLTSMQSAIVDIIVDAIYANNVDITQPVALLAEDSQIEGQQMPLPNNQWVLELQDMHNRALTQLQRLVVNYARGPGSPGAQRFIQKPVGEAKELCKMVRARTSGQFSNVNTYGLSITLALGMLIILINMFLVNLVTLFEKWRKVSPLRRETWIADGLLHLHAANIDTADAGPWNKNDESVPVTERLESVFRVSPRDSASLDPPETLTIDTSSQHDDLKNDEPVIEAHDIQSSGNISPASPVSPVAIPEHPCRTELGRV